MYPFELPKLSYPYAALEPHIDAQTMEIHHTKHHAAYVNNLNAAVEKHGDLHKQGLEDLLRNLKSLPSDIQTAVRNNGGGHANHTLFWQLLAPGGATKPSGALAKAIDGAFGSFDAFTDNLTKAGMGRFGSGWAWLAMGGDGKLQVLSTANQDHPVLEGLSAVLGLDVWEHAYYLKYQNRRADYIKAFWNVVNWDIVGQMYEEAENKASMARR